MRIIAWMIPLLCLSCSGLRMKPEERFLSATGNDSRIFIISLLGNQVEQATALLIAPPGTEVSSSMAYLSDFSNQASRPLFFYNDTVVPVNGQVFPSVIHSTNAISGFDFYLYRNKLLFIGYGKETTEINYYFPVQRRFVVDSTETKIKGVNPIKTSGDSPGTLFIHELEGVDSLFQRNKGVRYIWCDYLLNDQPQTLYFSLNAEDSTTVLYTTQSLTHIKLTSPSFQIGTENQCNYEFRFPPSAWHKHGKSDFNAVVAVIYKDEQPVGTAVLYLFIQP